MDDQKSNVDLIAEKIDAGRDMTTDELGIALAHSAEMLEKQKMEEEG